MMALLQKDCLVVTKSYGDSQGARKDLVKTSLGPAAWKVRSTQKKGKNVKGLMEAKACAQS